MIIREERPQDILSIAKVVGEALGQGAEAQLVEALRAGGGLTLSLVAEVAGQVKGHIALSPVTVDSPVGWRVSGLSSPWYKARLWALVPN